MKTKDDNLTRISRFLCLVLRHKPEAAGITLDEHGWANIDALIAGVSKKYPALNAKLLEQIVANDEKGRYAFSDDKKMIRCVQGHSIPVDLELEEKEPPAILYHGTCTRFTESIETYGLQSQTRQYIHLSAGRKTAVKVGSRHGDPVVYEVDTAAMYNDGYKFFRAANGVWLCRHIIPSCYLVRLPYDYVAIEDEKEDTNATQ